MEDDILKSFGLTNITFEQLTPGEKESYREIVDLQSKTVLTMEDFKKFITNIKNKAAVSAAEFIVVTEADKIKDAHLKARLATYITIEMFVNTPDRAREALNRMKSHAGIKS